MIHGPDGDGEEWSPSPCISFLAVKDAALVLGSRCSQREAPCVSVCNVTLFGCFYLPFSLVLDSLLMCLVVFFMFLVLGALDADFSGFVVVIKFEKFVHFFKYFFCPLSAFGGLQFTLRLQLELAPTAH